jgi:hypothetical protein
MDIYDVVYLTLLVSAVGASGFARIPELFEN